MVSNDDGTIAVTISNPVSGSPQFHHANRVNVQMNFSFQYLHDKPIIDGRDHPSLGGNINGPSLIKVPDWLAAPLGRYYLYFAHHEGTYIRLAVADELTGPWSIHAPGCLSLEQSLFCQHAPLPEDTHPDILASIAAGIEGDYPHIASPDMHIDPVQQKIIMYYHGRNPDGTQQTRRAESTDGINFTPLPPLLGDSYFRVFQHRQHHYAIAWGSVLSRSTDGGHTFTAGPTLTDDNYRHGAILQISGQTYVLWSRAGDCPESLLISPLNTESADWQNWRLGESTRLHHPQRTWEGIDEPLLPSTYGGAMQPVHELRDPCIYEEGGNVYLLYSVRGEQGIAMGRVTVDG